MADFATLVLAADSRALKVGERDLDSIAATAEKTERRVNKATDGVSKGLNDIGKASTFANGQMRATSMQLSQVAQQASATGDWLQAVAIQLPDLALGLGPIGILAGAAAGALLPLAANFLTASGNAEELEDAMSNLKKATDSYADAVANSLMPAEELIQKFGGQAESAGRVYDAMRKIAELDFTRSINNARTAMADTLQSLTESVETFEQLSSMPRMATDGFDAFAVEVQRLSHEFGLTTDQAQRIVQAMEDLSNAQGPVQISEAAANLGQELTNAVAAGAKLSPELENVQKDAYQASLDAAKFASLTQAAVGPAQNLADAVSGVADQYARAAAIAATLTAKYPSQGSYDGLIRTGDGPIQGSSDPDLPMNGPVPGSRGTPELSGFPWENFNKRDKASDRAAAKYDRERQSVADLIDELREELSLVGQTETAKRSAAAIRQAGATATDQEKEAIAGLIAQIDAEQEARDRQLETLEDYKDGVGSVLDDTRAALDDGKITWDEWADIGLNALDRVISKIQDDFLDAIFSVTNAGGGKGGWLSGLFSGIFGGTGGFATLPKTGPVPIARPSFDGGGSTGSGPPNGGLDGKGGFWAMMHPQETVIDHTKGQSNASGGQSIISVILSPELIGQVLQQAQGQSVKLMQQNEKNKRNLQQNGQEAYG